jgi:hypothetical protein
MITGRWWPYDEVLVYGECGDVKVLREEIASVLGPLGLRLSPAKTPHRGYERGV